MLDNKLPHKLNQNFWLLASENMLIDKIWCKLGISVRNSLKSKSEHEFMITERMLNLMSGLVVHEEPALLYENICTDLDGRKDQRI